MDDLIEFLFECLMNSRRVPKIIKYILAVLIVGFIVWVGISVGLNSPMFWGKIFGFTLAGVTFLAGIVWIIKISRS